MYVNVEVAVAGIRSSHFQNPFGLFSFFSKQKDVASKKKKRKKAVLVCAGVYISIYQSMFYLSIFIYMYIIIFISIVNKVTF